MADRNGDLVAADFWYQKSLTLLENTRDQKRVLGVCSELGMLAERRHDFNAAEEWYRRSLSGNKELNNKQRISISCAQMATLEFRRGNNATSGTWLIQAIQGFLQVNDMNSAHRAMRQFVVIHNGSPVVMQNRLRAIWDEADLGDGLPVQHRSTRMGWGIQDLDSVTAQRILGSRHPRVFLRLVTRPF